MPAPDGTDAVPTATLIVAGTVLRHGAGFDAVPPTEDEVFVLRVEDVRRAPAALHGFRGEITVRLPGGDTVVDGQRVVVQAVSWVFGEGIAVSAVAAPSLLAGDEAAATPGAATGLPEHLLAGLADRGGPETPELVRLADRVRAADTIVAGRVVSVTRLPADDGPKSEHDPQWHQAVVEVDSVEKGDAGTSVRVNYPNSRDVMWHHSPKYVPGQTGLFLLHRTDADRVHGLRRAVADSAEVFTSLAAADALPMTDLDLVRRLAGPT